MIKKKKLWFSAAGVLVVVIIAISLKIFNTSSGEMPVITTKLIKKDISTTVLVKGEVKSKTRSELSSDLTYPINKIFVKEGDEVKKGDVLATLDASDLNFEIQTANLEIQMQEIQMKQKALDENIYGLRKNVENEQINFESAKHKYETSKTLFKAGGLSKSELDNDYDNYLKTQNDLNIAKNNLNEAYRKQNDAAEKKSLELKKLNLKRKLDDLNKTTIVSPIDGTVTTINAKLGSVAQGTEGLFVVEDINNLEASLDVSEYDVGKLHIGKEVVLTTEVLPDKIIKGKITRIFPVVQTKEANSSRQAVIPVIVNIVNKVTGLRPGQVIEAKIEAEKQKDALVLPYETVLEKENKKNVIFVVVNGVLKEIPVKIGVEGNIEVQVISNLLKPGDIVALNPNETFKNGLKVKATEPGGPGNGEGKK